MKTCCIPNILPKTTVLNANLVSRPIPMLSTYVYCIQTAWTGTPTGVLKLQGSADPVAAAVAVGLYTGVDAPVNWSDISNTSFAITAAGTYMWNVQEIGYNWVRLVYTDSSGGASTAVLGVSTFNGKGI